MRAGLATEGNESGSPLLNALGEVVGVLTGSGRPGEVAFAVTIDALTPLLGRRRLRHADVSGAGSGHFSAAHGGLPTRDSFSGSRTQPLCDTRTGGVRHIAAPSQGAGRRHLLFVRYATVSEDETMDARFNLFDSRTVMKFAKRLLQPGMFAAALG